MTLRIFISYSQEDYRPGARHVRNYLSRHIQGADVFLDQIKTKGTKWKKEINSKLDESNIFVVILTHGALGSSQVEKEVLIAKEKPTRRIIPCKEDLLDLDWKSVKWDLDEYDGIEFEDKEELGRKLVTEIKKILKQEGRKRPLESNFVNINGLPNKSLKYQITNGEVLSAKIDREVSSLFISLASFGDGKIKLVIPRKIIDARSGDIDDDFFVMLDGEEVEFSEQTTNFDRTLTVPFHKGGNELEIIGTQILGISYHGVVDKKNIVHILQGSSTPRNDEKYLKPRQLFVMIGEKVRWINSDTAAHTVTSGSAADGPDGYFDSSLFMAGATFEVTFNQKGVYRYFDMVHPWIDGIITVS